MVDYSSDSVFGIVLLPEPEVEKRCVRSSEALNACSKSLVVLNEHNSLPHITVVHVECSEKNAASLWGVLKTKLQAGYEAETVALYIRPLKNKLWTGLDVRRTAQLDALHRIVVEESMKLELPISTEFGDTYWPHITLGRWLQAPNTPIPVTTLPLERFAVVPALTSMHEHGTVARVLARADCETAQ